MQNNHGSDVVYDWTVEQPRQVIEIEASALADLLLASHSCTTVEMSQEYPTLYKEYTASQDKARQALRWGEYAQKA